MPAFVIHTLGYQPRKLVIETSPVRVGRDPTNDIVIQEKSVSREHAMFVMDSKGGWHVSCVSDTNPIVVDGALITSGTRAHEGTEVLMGAENMVIFSETNFTANAYMGEKRYFEKSLCQQCKWTGMISTLRRDPVCPRCAAVLRSVGVAGSDTEQAGGHRVQGKRFVPATQQLNPEDVKAVWSKMQAAKHSSIERIDGRDADDAKRPLDEGAPITIGNGPNAALRLAGFFLIGSIHIGWDGQKFAATSWMKFPAMKVNGAKVPVAQLSNGDVIEVGSNRFRFTTGK